MKKFSLLTLIIALLLISCKPDTTRVTKVDYCELVQNPAAYDQRTVRLEAVQTVGSGTSYLSDPHCTDKAKTSMLTWSTTANKVWCQAVAPTSVAQEEKTFANRQEQLERNVTIVGTFHESHNEQVQTYPFALDSACLEQAGSWHDLSS